MFTSFTTRARFGDTYQAAILSVLPMDDNRQQGGLRAGEVLEALGLPNDARTSATILLKRLTSMGLVQRYDYRIKGRRFVTYKRIAPLGKRERLARWIWN
jgi:hypothetical protein